MTEIPVKKSDKLTDETLDDLVRGLRERKVNVIVKTSDDKINQHVEVSKPVLIFTKSMIHVSSHFFLRNYMIIMQEDSKLDTPWIVNFFFFLQVLKTCIHRALSDCCAFVIAWPYNAPSDCHITTWIYVCCVFIKI